MYTFNICKGQQDIQQFFTYSFTSQDFSWLQNGQLNIVSKGSMFFLLGGGFLFDFLLPIVPPEKAS